ncbi:MAG: CHRD domain-containing protein [bacterium]|nr:CHRD domain-containing protein [bacterium]
MTKKIIISSFLGLAMALSVSYAPEANANHSDDQEFYATLSGSREVPPVTTQTTGEAEFEFEEDEDGNELTYRLKIEDGQNITSAHIYCAGTNGAVVELFEATTPRTADILVLSGNIQDSDIMTDGAMCGSGMTTIEDLVAAMDEGELYVNVHSTQYSNGVIRGQISGNQEDDEDSGNDNEEEEDSDEEDADDEDDEEDDDDSDDRNNFDDMRNRFDQFRNKFNTFGM